MSGTAFCRSRASREGAWCPNGVTMTESEILFIGDSMFRYLHQHLPIRVNDLTPAVYFLSGGKTGDLFQGDHAGGFVSQKTRACVIHVGTNDLKTTPVVKVFESYRKVLADICEDSECEIFVSSVIPRCVDQYVSKPSTGMTQQLTELNEDISYLNEMLKALCELNNRLHFLCHDHLFWSTDGVVQSHLLARDGLHFSREGIKAVTRNLVTSQQTI